ncbi:MAG TPA: PqqD family protein [Methylomirabilota bacterium]|nr:PqqD family protein [Methylomirabilota bacterium]
MASTLSLASRVAIPAHVLSRPLHDEVVVLELKRGVYFGLDPVGTRIWQLLEQRPSLQDVVAALVEEYEVDPAQGGEDLLDLVEQLHAQGLLEIRD